MRRALIALLLLFTASGARAQSTDAFADLAGTLIFGTTTSAAEALATLEARGRADAAASLILALRYGRPSDARAVEDVLHRLTGATAEGWFEWMLWQEGADVRPHPGHELLQLRVWQAIDPRFAEFFESDVAPRIRREEIVWGGVRVDGIPALTDPPLVRSDAAEYLRADDLVYGVALGGEARAYPHRIVAWHEMVNDVVGGVPVSLAYCTLCNAPILFRTAQGDGAPHVFGSSGLLFRSNKLMYDTATRSLWNQFTGTPVVGALAASETTLDVLPVTITTWAEWRDRHPATTVLSLETGHDRDYAPGAAYRDYFASEALMFPARVDDDALAAKALVFGIHAPGGAAAWPLASFEGNALVHGRAGFWDVVLMGNAATRTVRAWRREAGERFRLDGDVLVRGDGARFRWSEAALLGPGGERRARVPGHLAYWFAWAGYLGGDTLAPATP